MTARRLWHRFLAGSYERQAKRLERSLGQTPRPPELLVRTIDRLAAEARGKAARYRGMP